MDEFSFNTYVVLFLLWPLLLAFLLKSLFGKMSKKSVVIFCLLISACLSFVSCALYIDFSKHDMVWNALQVALYFVPPAVYTYCFAEFGARMAGKTRKKGSPTEAPQ